MKLIIKNFIIVIKRFRVSCMLAVSGLSIAFAVFYMTAVQASYDLSFDSNFEKADSIYLYSRMMPNLSDSWRIVTNTFEPGECAERYSEIKNFCYLEQSDHTFDMKDDRTGEVRNFDGTVTSASIGFIEMFKPEILHGDVSQAFIPGNGMLTESIAKKIFGTRYPIGEVIAYHGSNQKLTVAAVCADFPDNCSLKNGIYQYQPEGYRQSWDYTAYFEIDPSNRDKLLKKMNDEQYMQKAANRPDEIWQYELTALPDIHLWFPAKGKGSPVTVISLLAMGILMLVVSYINFLNFSFAMAPVRAKNINIRKIFGEKPFALKLSIVMETVFLSFISFLLSVLVIYFLNTGAVKDFFRADLAMAKNPGLLCFAGLVSLVSGFLAGIYPAFYTTAFNPAMALSGSFFHSSHSKWLKNILTGVQFITAVFLIITTLFIKLQYDYLRNKNWGIQTENILYVNTLNNRSQVDNFMTELKRNSNIIDATAAAYFPGQETMQQWGRNFDSVRISINVWPVKADFFDFFGIKAVKGDRFKDNDKDKMILNRSFSNEYGFNDIEGKDLSDHEIIGVVEDFNFKSLHGGITPLAFIPIHDGNKGNYYNWVFVKTYGTNTMQTMEYIRDTWKSLGNDETVEVLSLTDTIQSLYRKERNTANLVSICGIIAIIVAVIGLYGLILFDSKARRKSIAIRRIHGASTMEIMLMLNQSLFIRFAISYLVGVPIAYYVVQRWLEDFAYKTPVHWWVFALGGFFVLGISLLTVSWESFKAASTNPVDVVKSE